MTKAPASEREMPPHPPRRRPTTPRAPTVQPHLPARSVQNFVPFNPPSSRIGCPENAQMERRFRDGNFQREGTNLNRIFPEDGTARLSQSFRINNRREAHPRPPFPAQKQPMPGSTDAMQPRPDHGETSYKGSGKLKGMKAVITGGDSGIGRAVAIAYAREGADVLIAFLNETEEANEVKKLVEKEGRKAVLVPGDLQDAKHCREVIKKAVDGLGGIDILVNNAAHQATFKDIGDISDEEWEKTFRTNIHSMFYLTKAAVPHMKTGSAIINTASVNSDMPNPMLLAYATTKGAIQIRPHYRREWLLRARPIETGHSNSELATKQSRSFWRARCRG